MTAAAPARRGPVVVLVLSHRYPEQVLRLVARVREGADTAVVVHHAPGGPPLDLPRADDVLAVPDPRPVRWGRLDLAQAVLRSMAHVQRTVPEHAWVLLVSGQDYPAQSVRRTEDELRTTPYDGFLRHVRLDEPGPDPTPWALRARRRYLGTTRLPGTHRGVPLPRVGHPFRHGVQLWGGGLWVDLSREAVGRVLESPVRGRVERFLGRSPIPDEALLHTLLLNNAAGLRLSPDQRRWIRWGGASPHPRTVTLEEVPQIASSGAFFTRKVDPVAHGDALDALDAVAAHR